MFVRGFITKLKLCLKKKEKKEKQNRRRTSQFYSILSALVHVSGIISSQNKTPIHHTPYAHRNVHHQNIPHCHCYFFIALFMSVCPKYSLCKRSSHEQTNKQKTDKAKKKGQLILHLAKTGIAFSYPCCSICFFKYIYQNVLPPSYQTPFILLHLLHLSSFYFFFCSLYGNIPIILLHLLTYSVLYCVLFFILYNKE